MITKEQYLAATEIVCKYEDQEYAARLARTLDEALDAPAGESPEEGESATHKTRRP